LTADNFPGFLFAILTGCGMRVAVFSGVRAFILVFLSLAGWFASTLLCPAQTFVSFDFEIPSDLYFANTISISPPIAPIVRFTNLDTGTLPHGKVLQLVVDASNQTNKWSSDWQRVSFQVAITNYDPAHTFLKFDAMVNRLRPVHAQIQFCGADCRDLDIQVQPTATNVFETFLVPLTAFTNREYILSGRGFPPYPTTFQFGMRGDAANPDTTWPCASNNVLLIDNVKYVVSPRVTISNFADTVVVSWPTNTADFTLQQCRDLGSSDWITVTNAVATTNSSTQVVVPVSAARGFYRLVGP